MIYVFLNVENNNIFIKSEKPRLRVSAFALLHQYENPFGLSPCRNREELHFRCSVFDV